MSSSTVYDAIVVGLGPVGAVAAHLLGMDGVSVLVIEAEAAVYPLPRAVHLDAHAARILQHLGLLSRLLSSPSSSSSSSSSPPASVMSPMSHCTFLDPAYQPLLRFPSSVSSLHGLHSSYLFSQPELERTLRSSLSLLPSVHLLLSCRVLGLEEDEKADVCIVSTDRGCFTSRYVLGCDGAKSTVRRLLGLRMLTLGWDDKDEQEQAAEDRGRDWLVVDGLMPAAVKSACGLSEEGVFQVCDGRRAVTLVSMRGEALRVEARLMRQPAAGEWKVASWSSAAWELLCYLALVVWSIAAPLLRISWAWKLRTSVSASSSSADCLSASSSGDSSPSLASLLPASFPLSSFTVLRSSSYRMQSLIASAFSSPSLRAHLLGDAAHVCPPYLGQGLCLGMRDAASLCFRIAHRDGLGHYQHERQQEAAELIARSGKVGQLLTTEGELRCRINRCVMRAVDRCAPVKQAMTAAPALPSAAVLYDVRTAGMLLWPQYAGSDDGVFNGSRLVVVGIDCDARRAVHRTAAEGQQEPHHDSRYHYVNMRYHYVNMRRRGREGGGRWAAWLDRVGMPAAGVVVLRPDRCVFGLYALRGRREAWWRSVIRRVLCRPQLVTYCDQLPFPVFADVSARLLQARTADR